MDWYHYLVLAVIGSQIAFLAHIYGNYRFAIKKYRKNRQWNKPKVALIVPCKGIDTNFDKNVASFFNQKYPNYTLWFVVEDAADAAYKRLAELKEKLLAASIASDVQIFVAGHSTSSSQKNHNLLYCYQKLPSDINIMAFADSDCCLRCDWLNHLIWPLRKEKYGASTGYRWFVPQKNNLATLALSALNAKVAQLLGNSPFNHAWGGSMAIKVDLFKSIGLDKIWAHAPSDDLSLTYAVRKAGRKLAYVPACLVASYEYITWPRLLEFARRQFVITRVCCPLTWFFGLFATLYSASGL